MSEPKISVIIPVRNEADKIERCLEAVLFQSPKPYEVIIVDGHSNDETIERTEKFLIKILFEDYHTRGGACQVGVEHTEGEYVAFTDADCIPGKDWLANLVKKGLPQFPAGWHPIHSVSPPFRASRSVGHDSKMSFFASHSELRNASIQLMVSHFSLKNLPWEGYFSHFRFEY